MSNFDPLQKHRRLWNDPRNVLQESLAGSLLMHPNLVYLDSCKAVLRRDYSRLNGKVRVIGGGALIDGPMYPGFIGPGMLTAAIFGLENSASCIPTTESIIEVINHVVKDKQQGVNGVLLLVHDCAEYFLNFTLAQSQAEKEGIPIKLLFVRDELSDKLNQKPSSPRSPSGLLLHYKIAGAMAEEGRTLNEIYLTCNNIIMNRSIFSIGAYITESSSRTQPELEISRGDRLSDRDIKRFPVQSSSTAKIVKSMMNEVMKPHNRQNFPRGSKLSLLLDYFGGFSEMEANLVIKELIEQLHHIQLEVEIVHAGTFHVSMEVNGFHLSLLNLIHNQQLISYLKTPTIAFSWFKASFRIFSPQNIAARKSLLREASEKSKTTDDQKKPLSQEGKLGSSCEPFEHELLITAIEYACRTVIACGAKIDMLDKSKDFIDNKCGKRLANTAKTLITAIHKKEFFGLNPSQISLKIASMFEDDDEDTQAGLYRLFFFTIGKTLKGLDNLDANDYFEAFVAAIDVVDNITKGTKFSDTLFAAKAAYCDAFANNESVNPLNAFGEAVVAAQQQTSHITPESAEILGNDNGDDSGCTGLAGAHAIGIWMRGAYEGLKLKYSRMKLKRAHAVDSAPDDDIFVEKQSKVESS
ncbi:hypothetical protein QAD02_015431 [Eretmocerus hayati]|uniref:Uncharacterized protein n=1 Tax=Eretmocerus hayati TaxID=131215 RepID=A0ACC2P7T9_9HYME|nr:hypothetical protein QAD02_015431 [Eretmocerus hayati]